MSAALGRKLRRKPRPTAHVEQAGSLPNIRRLEDRLVERSSELFQHLGEIPCSRAPQSPLNLCCTHAVTLLLSRFISLMGSMFSSHEPQKECARKARLCHGGKYLDWRASST